MKTINYKGANVWYCNYDDKILFSYRYKDIVKCMIIVDTYDRMITKITGDILYKDISDHVKSIDINPLFSTKSNIKIDISKFNDKIKYLTIYYHSNYRMVNGIHPYKIDLTYKNGMSTDNEPFIGFVEYKDLDNYIIYHINNGIKQVNIHGYL